MVQRVTKSESEWQRVIQRIIKSESEWEQLKHSGLSFKMKTNLVPESFIQLYLIFLALKKLHFELTFIDAKLITFILS